MNFNFIDDNKDNIKIHTDIDFNCDCCKKSIDIKEMGFQIYLNLKFYSYCHNCTAETFLSIFENFKKKIESQKNIGIIGDIK